MLPVYNVNDVVGCADAMALRKGGRRAGAYPPGDRAGAVVDRHLCERGERRRLAGAQQLQFAEKGEQRHDARPGIAVGDLECDAEPLVRHEDDEVALRAALLGD